MPQPQPAPFDYNDPVFRQGTEAQGMDFSTLKPEFNDIHPYVADRLAELAPRLVLDLGCGPAKLGKLLDERGVPWVGLDAAIRRLELGVGQRVLGDGNWLPFGDGSFDAVATLYTLYHFSHPAAPVREALRVLKPGGTFVTAAPSRFDDPELAPYLPAKPPETFDLEIGEELLGAIFGNVQVVRWDMPLYRLPDRQAVWTYLVSRQTPPEVAARAAESVPLPLWLTKRGASLWAVKR